MVDQNVYYSQYATNLVQLSIQTSLDIVGNAPSIAKGIVNEGFHSSGVTNYVETFSEKMSLKVISQCLSANLYANKAAQQIISSVLDTLNGLPLSTFCKVGDFLDESSDEPVNRLSGQLMDFVDAISSQIFYDAAKDLVKSVDFYHPEQNNNSSINLNRYYICS